MDGINVIIIDDHEFLVAGLVTLLKPYHQVNITGAYTEVTRLKEALTKERPGVLLMDLLMPDQSGKDLATELLQLYPDLRILVLTSIDTPAMVSTMMRKGCYGYALKDTKPEHLVQAIEMIGQGEKYIEPSIKEQLLEHTFNYTAQSGRTNIIPELSMREKEILKLIASEYTTKEISEKLFISSRTAESHRYNLIQKLGVKNTAGLVKVAIRLGLLNDDL